MDRRALLLDIGGVVLRSGHEMMPALAARRPEVAGWAARRGTLGPEPDPAWHAMLAGDVTERAYWAGRAEEVGPLVGRPGRTGDLMDLLYADLDDADVLGGDVFRPEALDLMDDARADGVVLGALTNDLAAFHGAQDLAAHPVFARFDVVVDGSVTGVLKPDPRAYALALDALGVPAGAVVFLDDIPGNVAGGTRAGMRSVPVDLARPGEAFARARELLGLLRRAA